MPSSDQRHHTRALSLLGTHSSLRLCVEPLRRGLGGLDRLLRRIAQLVGADHGKAALLDQPLALLDIRAGEPRDHGDRLRHLPLRSNDALGDHIDDLLRKFHNYHPEDKNIAEAKRPFDRNLMDLILSAKDANAARQLIFAKKGINSL